MGTALPSKIELHLAELRHGLDRARAQDPRQFAEGVRAYLEANYRGNVEFDRLWKLLVREVGAGDARRGLRFTVLQPHTVYGHDPNICLWSRTDGALVITGLEITTDAAARDIQANLYRADDFRTKANATLVRACTTSSGVLSLAGLSLAVPANRAVYLTLTADPSVDMTQFALDIRYEYAG